MRTTGEGRAVENEVLDVVVANGIFSDPLLPAFPGTDEFRAAGDRYHSPSDFADLDEVLGKHVVVIGYGRSVCDVAVALDAVSASTTGSAGIRTFHCRSRMSSAHPG